MLLKAPRHQSRIHNQHTLSALYASRFLTRHPAHQADTPPTYVHALRLLSSARRYYVSVSEACKNDMWISAPPELVGRRTYSFKPSSNLRSFRARFCSSLRSHSASRPSSPPHFFHATSSTWNRRYSIMLLYVCACGFALSKCGSSEVSRSSSSVKR
jgi:hypothetical protein